MSGQWSVRAKPILSLTTFAELLCIFALFTLQGAYPLPHVNEPNYLGKAVHYWNPDWARGDFFLQTADPHATFYWTFGWLSRWLSLPALAWTGRLITWALLACGWQRLSRAVVERPWYAVLSAVLLIMLLDYFPMAGEWIFGGVEAKGFAYALVFFALAEVLRDRWNRAWILLGAASAFHVLVGGWTVLALVASWLMLRQKRPRLISMFPGLALGLLLSLLGLIPAMLVNRGTDPASIERANIYYVYFRLWHHLDPLQIAKNTPHLVALFLLLCAVWLILWRKTRSESRMRTLAGLVNASLLFALMGVAVGLLQFYDEDLAARLLRFYWFRLSDVAVPLGVALTATWLIAQAAVNRRVILMFLLLLLLLHSGVLLARRGVFGKYVGYAPALAVKYLPPPFVDQGGYNPAWRDACQWVVSSGKIEANARFITPMMSQTFKWYTGRPEVVNHKELPQDAAAMDEWLDRLQNIFGKNKAADNPDDYWYRSLAERDARDVRRLAAKYGADYVLTFCDPPLPLPVVYKNVYYVIYKMGLE